MSKGKKYNAQEYIGRRFGNRLITGISEPRGTHQMVHTRCDCGHLDAVALTSLINGLCNSCKNCWIKRQTSHKMSRTPEYLCWCSMKKRCNNPTDIAYKDYGARGITVCERWLDFANFYEDMGPRPKGTSLDRIDNNKGYSKENCRWATPKEQCANKSLPKQRALEAAQQQITKLEALLAEYNYKPEKKYQNNEPFPGQQTIG